MVLSKKFVIVKHFEGKPKSSDLALVEELLPLVKMGEFMIEAEYISIDPGMRQYSNLQAIGDVMFGLQLGKIVVSKNSKFPVGERIRGWYGWRTHTIIDPNKWEKHDFISEKPRVLPNFGELSPSIGLGILGMPGETAYFGLLEICQPKIGETLVVSGAAGAVGSHVGQIGKIKGLNVIGIAGSDEKCKWLVDELGFDYAINYKTQDLSEALKNAAPNGIDCYFDNVGGEISSAVIFQMNDFGRISVCGSISCYNSEPQISPMAKSIQFPIVCKQLKMEGFLVHRWENRYNESFVDNYKWIQENKLILRETIYQGFENTFQAFIGTLNGDNIGKTIVKLDS
ncbi:prostaglandin reductase 1-like isoform X1 [Leptopilina boulardi]|uniref:prostaglandin reductase 1-like isoform X1 n=2 Tax=Leptopilina boulardi TaxID=63433 RepID=UPI0021F67558|nr:prostaglandin reductase 1-like isoform X1 [Leptopilina boulardi]